MSLSISLSLSCTFIRFISVFSLHFLSLSPSRSLGSCTSHNTFVLMGQINYLLLLNSYLVCVTDKFISLSVNWGWCKRWPPPPPPPSLSISLSFTVSHSITVSASGLDNVKQTLWWNTSGAEWLLLVLQWSFCSWAQICLSILYHNGGLVVWRDMSNSADSLTAGQDLPSHVVLFCCFSCASSWSAAVFVSSPFFPYIDLNAFLHSNTFFPADVM